MCTKVNSPDRGPQPRDIGQARKADVGFDISTSEAKFIPRLNHATLVLKIVILLLGQGYNKGAISRGNRCGVKPFHVIGSL